MITVLEPGARSLIQDLGRHGYRAQGVGTSGAYDEIAHRVANACVGNAAEAATLEVTLSGPVLRFQSDAIVAIAGATFEATCDGTPVQLSRPILMEAGATLRIGRATSGLRAYLAVRGGFDEPLVLGSRSTHSAATLGPAALRTGAKLRVGSGPTAGEPRHIGPHTTSSVVRVVPTGTWNNFSGIMSTRTDRTGARLELEIPMPGGEIDPEPMLPGAIQVPPDGHPIVLGPDAPVTGGYPVIGVVAKADRGLLAQSRPGTRLSFEAVTATDARKAWDDALQWIATST